MTLRDAIALYLEDGDGSELEAMGRALPDEEATDTDRRPFADTEPAPPMDEEVTP